MTVKISESFSNNLPLDNPQTLAAKPRQTKVPPEQIAPHGQSVAAKRAAPAPQNRRPSPFCFYAPFTNANYSQLQGAPMSGNIPRLTQKPRRRPEVFVCICNALNDRTVRDIVSTGSATPAAIHRAAGCRPQCGRCLTDMAEMIDDHRTASAFAQAAD
jgi:bacterioferritin-associated ferredoxin